MSRAVTIVGYVLLAASAIGLEIAARRSGRVAAFGAVVSAALRAPAVRLLIIAGWLWLGWHLFVRVAWR